MGAGTRNKVIILASDFYISIGYNVWPELCSCLFFLHLVKDWQFIFDQGMFQRKILCLLILKRTGVTLNVVMGMYICVQEQVIRTIEIT